MADGDHAGLERLVREMGDRIAAGRYSAGSVVPTIAEGFAAYASSDWDRAIRQFERALPETVRIGGGRAQRDLIEHTLLAAYLKAGRPEQARDLIARRATVAVTGFTGGRPKIT